MKTKEEVFREGLERATKVYVPIADSPLLAEIDKDQALELADLWDWEVKYRRSATLEGAILLEFAPAGGE